MLTFVIVNIYFHWQTAVCIAVSAPACTNCRFERTRRSAEIAVEKQGTPWTTLETAEFRLDEHNVSTIQR
jgi:hypothetical protein